MLAWQGSGYETLEVRTYLGEIFGAVAIVVSSIFVGLEVRENTRVTALKLDYAADSPARLTPMTERSNPM